MKSLENETGWILKMASTIRKEKREAMMNIERKMYRMIKIENIKEKKKDQTQKNKASVCSEIKK